MPEYHHPALEPVVVEGGVVRCFQSADGKRHLWPSNFFVRPLNIGGAVYTSLEHYYQAMKSLDASVRGEIAFTGTPGQSKRSGRSVACRPDWEFVKNTVMLTALHEKFAPGTDLAQALVDTGDAAIIEGNTWHDQVWGDCSCGRGGCREPGENRLGRMLMRQREILISI